MLRSQCTNKYDPLIYRLQKTAKRDVNNSRRSHDRGFFEGYCIERRLVLSTISQDAATFLANAHSLRQCAPFVSALVCVAQKQCVRRFGSSAPNHRRRTHARSPARRRLGSALVCSNFNRFWCLLALSISSPGDVRVLGRRLEARVRPVRGESVFDAQSQHRGLPRDVQGADAALPRRDL